LSTTDDTLDQPKTFEVTHPFHPLYKNIYEIVTVKEIWGTSRVSYYDSNKRLTSMPTAWTSLRPKDPYCILAAGRCDFSYNDLLKLAKLIEQIKQNKSNKKNNIEQYLNKQNVK